MHFDGLVSGKKIGKFERIVVNGSEIESVSSFKYLGFIIEFHEPG